MLNNILTGKVDIINKPWRQKNGEDFWFIDLDGTAHISSFNARFIDFIALVYMGNCFRSLEDAEAHRDEIMAKHKEVLK